MPQLDIKIISISDAVFQNGILIYWTGVARIGNDISAGRFDRFEKKDNNVIIDWADHIFMDSIPKKA